MFFVQNIQKSISPFITLFKRHFKPDNHQLLKSEHKIKETIDFKKKKSFTCNTDAVWIIYKNIWYRFL